MQLLYLFNSCCVTYSFVAFQAYYKTCIIIFKQHQFKKNSPSLHWQTKVWKIFLVNIVNSVKIFLLRSEWVKNIGIHHPVALKM